MVRSMAHTQANAKNITSRIRRIQGQLESIVRAVESEEDCFRVLQTAAACRGAFSGLLLELLDQHVQTHIVKAKTLPSAQKESKELTKVLRSYFK